MERVLVDQGSDAEIMYHDLYMGLNLRPEDMVSYDSPPMGFGSKVVEVNFIVVDAYSTYTAILARPWLHSM